MNLITVPTLVHYHEEVPPLFERLDFEDKITQNFLTFLPKIDFCSHEVTVDYEFSPLPTVPKKHTMKFGDEEDLKKITIPDGEIKVDTMLLKGTNHYASDLAGESGYYICISYERLVMIEKSANKQVVVFEGELSESIIKKLRGKTMRFKGRISRFVVRRNFGLKLKVYDSFNPPQENDPVE